MYPSLLSYNTFRINATCREFHVYDSIDQLVSLLPQLVGQRWLHIGGGSNLLFVTPHFDGIVLHSRIRSIEVVERTSDSVLLRVGAGEDWDAFVAYCVEHGFYGLENLSFIPGQVGASAVQNVGAYGVEAGDHIEAVETIDTETGENRLFSHAECHYAYRSSIFQHECQRRYVVTHVLYRLSLTFHPVLTHTAVVRILENSGLSPDTADAAALRHAVVEVRRAKLPDPHEVGSAGSFFMNPIVSETQAQQLLSTHPEMPHYPASNGVKVPAGWLIEQCGWKGRTLGRAGVHPMQALVLINLGQATGSEVVQLATAIQNDVKQRFDIALHPEALDIH